MKKEEFKERLTNQQVVVRLMNHSTSGALMHAFMFTAMEAYAAQILNNEEETRALMAGGMVDADAWMNCAREIKQTLSEHLDSIFPPEATAH